MAEQDNEELGTAVEENLLAEATRLHADTWGGYLRTGKTSSEDILHLSNFLPKLRKQLNCSVCKGILSHVPMVSKSSCQHAVCKECLTDDMQICTKDIPCVEYEESKCLSLFVQTYTLFCLTILRSKESRDHIQSAEKEPGFNGIRLVELLKEGALKQKLYGLFPNSPPRSSPSATSSRQSSVVEDDRDRSIEASPPVMTMPGPYAPGHFPSPQHNSSATNTNESCRSPFKRSTKVRGFKESKDSGSQRQKSNEVVDIFQLPPAPVCKVEPFSIPESANYDDVEDEEESGSEGGVLLTSSVLFNNGSTEGNDGHFHPPMVYAPVPNTQQWPDPSRILQYGSGVESVIKLERSSTPPPETAGIVGSVVRAVQGSGKKLKVRLPKQPASPKSRKGCRCGNATVAPGKLTCCGQRCPCYVENRACYECRCKGCRNPHAYDGKKFLPGPGLNGVEIKPAINSLGTTTQPIAVGHGHSHVHGAGIFHNYSDHGAQFFPLGLGPLGSASFDGYLTSLPIISTRPIMPQPHPLPIPFRMENFPDMNHPPASAWYDNPLNMTVLQLLGKGQGSWFRHMGRIHVARHSPNFSLN